MATRSSIHMQTENKLVSIYSHWDGYPSHHGPILLNHINTPELVAELMSYGNVSSLGANLSTNEPHTFDHPQEGVCVFYGRDRNEKEQEAVESVLPSDLKPTLKRLPIAEEFQYLYKVEEKQWYVMTNKTWAKLTLAKCEKEA